MPTTSEAHPATQRNVTPSSSMKILVVGCAVDYAHSPGKLNHALTQLAEKTLQKNGHQVKVTNIGDGYTLADEVEKIMWCDVMIYQFPVWWFGVPWMLKKYMDEVFTEGHGKLYANDGRTRSDPSKTYGSGGLLSPRKYMLSMTWNAPVEALILPEQFFDGGGVDTAFSSMHKANQFLAMEPLPTFSLHDVMKDFQPSGLDEYEAHLGKVFGKNISK